MKKSSWFSIAAVLTGGLLVSFQTVQAAPKKVLVVSTTTGFRHTSIETGEAVIEQLGKQTGEFTVEYARVNPNAEEFKGTNGRPDMVKVLPVITKVLAEKMSPAALANYDGIIFCNTTGDLPIPDQEGLLNWIKSGKAFIGMHACSDTLHHWPAFSQMLGGEFAGHDEQVGLECVNQDRAHPATATLGPSLVIKQEEIYRIKGYDAKDCRELLVMEKLSNRALPRGGRYKPGDFAGAGQFNPDTAEQPGRFPVSWCKPYGQGKIFYTTLGHREDIWDPDWKDRNGQRVNPPEVSKAYQQHILGGIRWALGLVPGDARPQTAPKE